MSHPLGEIDLYLEAVGLRAHDGDAVPDLIVLIGEGFETETLETDGRLSTFWSFSSSGVELEWVAQRLVHATVYLQGSADEGYRPYPRRLFAAFPNTAEQSEVQAALGAPDLSGYWNGPWIR